MAAGQALHRAVVKAGVCHPASPDIVYLLHSPAGFFHRHIRFFRCRFSLRTNKSAVGQMAMPETARRLSCLFYLCVLV